MSSTKSARAKRPHRPELPPEALELVAALFQAMAEPLRLRILQALQEGEMSVTRVAERLGATQPNVSKHLKILLGAGLVRRRQIGNQVLCAIADDMVFELCDTVCERVRERLEAQAGALRLTARA